MLYPLKADWNLQLLYRSIPKTRSFLLSYRMRIMLHRVLKQFSRGYDVFRFLQMLANNRKLFHHNPDNLCQPTCTSRWTRALSHKTKSRRESRHCMVNWFFREVLFQRGPAFFYHPHITRAVRLFPTDARSLRQKLLLHCHISNVLIVR